MGIRKLHIDQGFETLPGGARTSRLDGNLPDVSFYDPEVISELYTRCTEHCGPPNVNRIAKVQVVAKIFKMTSQWNASYMLEFMGSRQTISPPTHIKSWPIDCTEEIDSY